MFQISIFFIIFLAAQSGFAGSAHVDRALIRNVECVILESLPLQYSGTAQVTLLNSEQRVTMKFPTGEDVDIYEICTHLQDQEGSRVSLIYNIDEFPGEEPTTYLLKGFIHRGHSHIIDGSQFEDSE